MTNQNSLKKPKVSIIIVNYNGRHLLNSCLSSILDIHYPSDRYEVILVDNASTDGSLDYVHKKFPWVRTLKLLKNYGYPGGCNRGAKIAVGDAFVFLNTDIYVHKSWLRQLVKVAYADLKIGMCGSKMIAMNDHNIIQYNGYILHSLGGVLHFPFNTIHNEFNQKINIVGSVQGASFLIKKSVFNKLNGFQDDYFLYSDEVDLSHRAWINGYYVAYAPDSIVYHYGGGSIEMTNNSRSGLLNKRLESSYRLYYGNKNAIINIIKNFELRNMISGIIFSYIFLFVQFLILLKDKDIKNIKLLLKSYLWPIKNFKSIWKKRIFTQENRTVSDKELKIMRVLLSNSGLIKFLLKLIFLPKG